MELLSQVYFGNVVGQICATVGNAIVTSKKKGALRVIYMCNTVQCTIRFVAIEIIIIIRRWFHYRNYNEM